MQVARLFQGRSQQFALAAVLLIADLVGMSFMARFEAVSEETRRSERDRQENANISLQ
jgi:hypothetical protein